MTNNISPTCEVLGKFARGEPVTYCGKPTASWYPTLGHGTIALCEEHGKPHAKYATRVDTSAGTLPERARE